MKAIINANIVLETGIIWDGTILTDGEEISAFGKDIGIPENAEIIDANGSYVGPGFVDIHVHGINGFHTALQPVEAAEYFLKHGETTILATPAYDFDKENMLKCIRTLKENMDKTPNIRGLYMEGPYTNPEYGSHAYLNPWRHGVHPEDYIEIVDEASDLAKVWTIAPELDGIKGFVEYARKVNHDTIIAVGHSHATPDMIRALGSRYRPKILTHMGCATPVLPPLSGGTRGAGPDEYFMQNPDTYCEMISDSCAIHVNPDIQKLLIHAKGVERVILITDSTEYIMENPPQYAHIDDLNFDDIGGLAGSKMTLDRACRNVMASTTCGIAQAFIMASTTPAKAIDMYDEIGSVEVGKKADLVFVDDRFNVKNVMLRGDIV